MRNFFNAFFWRWGIFEIGYFKNSVFFERAKRATELSFVVFEVITLPGRIAGLSQPNNIMN